MIWPMRRHGPKRDTYRVSDQEPITSITMTGTIMGTSVLFLLLQISVVGAIGKYRFPTINVFKVAVPYPYCEHPGDRDYLLSIRVFFSR